MSEKHHHGRLLQQVFGTDQPVALVTGSGGGPLGNCIACELADRGYRLMLHANRSTEQAAATAEKLGKQTEVDWHQADVQQPEAVEQMIEHVVERFQRLDAVIHCAAIWDPKPVLAATAEDVMRHFRINALSTFLLNQKAGAVMKDQSHGGSIVNFGDFATVRPYRGYAAYFPSKGAIPTMTRDMAIELARHNPRIRVNAVLPGPVTLPDDMPEADRRSAASSTLTDLPGEPQYVAHAVIFLLENQYVTGHCLPVDGGSTIFAASDHWRA